jgi:hypothetical protein
MLLPTSNNPIVPALKKRVVHLRRGQPGLGYKSPGWGNSRQAFFEPGDLKMILEVLAIYVLIQCSSVFARLIGRRRDVFHYVTRSNLT